MAQQKALTSWPPGATTATVAGLAIGAADTVAGSIFADQSGTLYVEQSGDNQNWDVSSAFPVTANQGQGFKIDALLTYVRARFVLTVATPAPVAFRLYVRSLSAGTQM